MEKGATLHHNLTNDHHSGLKKECVFWDVLVSVVNFRSVLLTLTSKILFKMNQFSFIYP